MMELTEQQRKELSTYPKINITKGEFDKLPEYSLSTPTQTEGAGTKKWKHRTPYDASEQDSIWFIGKVEGSQIVFYLPTIT